MKKQGIIITCLLLSHIASADGFYVGAKTGAVIANFKTSTSTSAGSLFNASLAQTANSVGSQNIHPTGFLGGIAGGYEWQHKQWFLGLEADIQSLSINTVNYSAPLPYSNNPNNQLVITTYANNNWLLTARPRLGFAGEYGSLYATGGVGLTYLQNSFVFADAIGNFISQQISQSQAGWVVGGGVETPFTSDLSLKTEYLFGSYPRVTAGNLNLDAPAGQPIINQTKLNQHLITVGLNYHFNHPLSHTHLLKLLQPESWESEIGARVFFSNGLAGAPQPLLNIVPPINDQLASRLIFSGLGATSEEAFARFENQAGLFAKGYLGAGSVTRGQMNDEDFPAVNAYSNTLSSIKGNLAYGTVDLGYTFLKNPHGKVGAFIGYNYYTQSFNATNCEQLAGDVVCVPSGEFVNLTALSEADTYQSLRLGLSSQLHLAQQFTLTSDAAYLPLVFFNGLDLHNARQLVGPESSSKGDGAMLETILSYQFAPSWNIGVGGRYWTWNMHDGSVIFDFLGDPDISAEPARFNTTRYGAFLQLNYKHDPNALPDTSEPTDWRGLFIGGELGGAFGHNHWSDPFGSTPGISPYMNIAGFGDKISASGPLGGANLHLHLFQTEHFVYGVSGSISGSDIRGENTLFSGLGGINGKTLINGIGTITGRIGTPFYHSLLYVDAGGAVLDTQYTLNGNTGALNLGEERITQYPWGWTVGVGVEFALSPLWTTTAEYDYIGIPNQAVSFPSLALISDQSLETSQNLNVFKIGIGVRVA